MTNGRFFARLMAGIAITLLGMVGVTQMVARPLVRGFDVSESFVSSVMAIMTLMGLVATVAFIIWYVTFSRRMQRAVNPGLVHSRKSAAIGGTAAASVVIYALLAVVNIGLDDWSTLALSTLISVIAACIAAGLLWVAMRVAEEAF